MIPEALELPKRTDVRSGISRPKSIRLSRLCALRRAYFRSTVHIALQEICNLPRHMDKCRRTNPPSMPVDLLILPSEPRENHAATPIIDGCIAGIQRVRNQLGPGRLGIRLYARGFDEGAKWMWSSCRDRIDTRIPTEYPQPSQQKTSSGEFITPKVSR
jgi:hypothetical protein